MLQSDPSISNVFSNPPVHARRQPPNLRKLLVRSSLESPCNDKGNIPCGKPRCNTSHHVNTNPEVRIGKSKIHLKPFSCDSSNVVYLLYCNKCSNSCYIGETRTKFRLRFNNHLSSIRRKVQGLPIADHFNNSTADHSLTDLKFALLSGGFPNDRKRKCAEIQYIINCVTVMSGLNKDLGELSRYRHFRQTSC